MARRGAKSLTARDWLFGSRPRRLALQAIVRTPGRRWTKTALATEAGVSAQGGIDEHLAGFVRIGLVLPDGRAFVLADPPPAFAGTLGDLLDELQVLPDDLGG